MGTIIVGIVMLAILVFALAYAVVRIAQDKHLPHYYITVPLAVLVGMFVMSAVRNV